MDNAAYTPVFWPTSRRLPDYTAVLAVDAKGYTELPSVDHAPMSRMISGIVDQALVAAGLGDLRMNKCFSANTGDGVVLGFSPARLPFVLWPFLDVLDRLLAEQSTSSTRARLRLRAAVHVGPLPIGAAGDGNGAARNDVHRLLDARELKRLLVASDPGTTHLVAVISRRVYEDVVLGQYTGLRPDRCSQITATVAGRDFSQTAWVYVPSPSGDCDGGRPGRGAGAWL